MPAPTIGLWEKHVMALDEVTARLQRITKALTDASVPYALVGGQAVALWVATKDPAAVRTTKDVDILLRREDLPRARAAAASVSMDYFEVIDVGMFLERDDPNPRKAVHLIWAGEKVKPEYALPSPMVDDSAALESDKQVVLANRDQDRSSARHDRRRPDWPRHACGIAAGACGPIRCLADRTGTLGKQSP
jgi:hypothetical protein